jgi:hypothetical protein
MAVFHGYSCVLDQLQRWEKWQVRATVYAFSDCGKRFVLCIDFGGVLPQTKGEAMYA